MMATVRPATGGQSAVLAGSPNLGIRRLTHGDAPAIAALEAATYPRELRAGARKLRRDLIEAEWHDENLSVGLFDSDRLAGFVLMYYESDARRTFGYFGLPLPDDQPREECVYVADFIVAPQYRHFMTRLFRAAWLEHRGYYGVPILGFSVGRALERWQARPKALARLGYALASIRAVGRDRSGQDVSLVRYESAGQPRYARPERAGLEIDTVRCLARWEELQPVWDELLKRTPDWTPLQTYRLQRHWWSHFGHDSSVFIVVFYDGARVRAIAPFRIAVTTHFGRPRRRLCFIGAAIDTERPRILTHGDDGDAVNRIVEYVNTRDGVWDSFMLYEQSPDGAVLRAAAAAFTTPRYLTEIVLGPDCPWVDLRGSWQDFLSSKGRAFRKGLGQKRRRLEQLDEVRFETAEDPDEAARSFEKYLAVEARSWKPAARQGVAKCTDSECYYREFVQRPGIGSRVLFHFLTVGGEPIAATFGILDHGRFASLHIAYDSGYAAYSPGVLLTAYELEQAYARDDMQEFDFLGGFLENKTTWTDELRRTRQLFVYRKEFLFSVVFLWQFRAERHVKAALKRVGLHRQVVRLVAFLDRLRGRGQEEHR